MGILVFHFVEFAAEALDFVYQRFDGDTDFWGQLFGWNSYKGSVGAAAAVCPVEAALPAGAVRPVGRGAAVARTGD